MLWKWQMNFVKIRGYEYEMNMQSVKMCEIMCGKFLSSSCFMTSGKSGLPKQSTSYQPKILQVLYLSVLFAVKYHEIWLFWDPPIIKKSGLTVQILEIFLSGDGTIWISWLP